jgi:hypothetical protein
MKKAKLEAAFDELASGKSTEEIVELEVLLNQLTKPMLERAMNSS